jgi:1-acyl-sn-glycerol-3-phosphate acyltransferase
MRRIVSFLISLVLIPILYVILVIGALVVWALYPFGRRVRLWFAGLFYRWWCRALFASTLSRVEIDGELPEKCESVVFFANHSSYVDICAVSGYIDSHASYVARRSLIKLFPIGLWVLAADGVFVERRGSRRELEAILLIIERVKSGRRFVVFPEGTRTRTGELGEIKAGTLKIPQKAGVPIIPLRIEGTAKVLPRGAKWFKPADIRIVVGEPIYPEEITSDRDGVIERLKAHMRAITE